MEIENLEIRDYLSQSAPFDVLDSETLDKVTLSLEISYAKRDSTLLKPGDINHSLYLISSGSLEVYDLDNNLSGRFDSGDWVGYKSLMRDGKVSMLVKATEDSLLYEIPGSLFLRLLRTYDQIRYFFSEQKPERLRHAVTSIQSQEKNNLVGTQVRELISHPPLLVDKSTTISQAAQMMATEQVSAVLVTDNDQPLGIVTDRTFCTQVVAQELDINNPIDSIMTPDLLTLPSHRLSSEALLMMARNNINHVPITEGKTVTGMLTTADLIRLQSHNAVYLINEIHRAQTVEGLTQLSKQLPSTLVSLVKGSLTAYDIGHAISSIGEAICKHLLNMAEEKLGSPPVPYAFIIAGSQSRNEQTAHSDQDNALIISDDYNAEKHGAYFAELTQFVSDGLNDCGYVYCPGDVMASNQKWRQPLSTWKKYFNNWITVPELKSLMYACIFFDLRCIHGETSFLDELQTEVLSKTKKNSIFLQYMATNALHYRPPLGMFRNLILEKHGEEKKALDMKKRGVVPITDLSRVYALEAGIRDLNTVDRLEAACEAGTLSQEGMADLRDTFEFVSAVRLQHQAHQIEQNEAPNNFISPEHLSSLERRHLKDAFDVVRTMQAALESRY